MLLRSTQNLELAATFQVPKGRRKKIYIYIIYPKLFRWFLLGVSSVFLKFRQAMDYSALSKVDPEEPRKTTYGQWEFQDPKMERPYFVGIFPYIGLT